MTPHEVEQIATKAAREAVRETLLTMGVDVSKPDALLSMQLDFAHTRRVRLATETIGRQSIMTAVAVAVTAFAGLIYAALRGTGKL